MNIGSNGADLLLVGVAMALLGVHVQSWSSEDNKSQEILKERTLAAETDDWGKQQQWIRIGKDAIRTKLKDADSAKFKNVYFNRGKDRVPVTCGLVNAKNSFGGYSGFEHFVSAGSYAQIVATSV